jgi:hypothetical protein
MALVLMLREGEDFFIGGQRVVLEKIDSQSAFVLYRDADGKRFSIQEGRATELFKGVMVSAGARGQLGLARVSIEAPRSIMIVRGEVTRRASRSDPDTNTKIG